MSYEELPHTADIRIRAEAATLSALFADLTAALMEALYGKAPANAAVINRVTKEISTDGDDLASLLLNYLSEVLYVSEVDSTVFFHAEVMIRNHSLHAILTGEPFDPARHAGGTEVKGISYSGLVVRKEANGYMAEIVFDV